MKVVGSYKPNKLYINLVEGFELWSNYYKLLHQLNSHTRVSTIHNSKY